MLDNPKLSVIMSVYNGEKYLREAIESILNQTFTDFEFIIINDGSTDNSLAIIRSYDDRRIRSLNNETNIGLTKSLNNALKVATGEYIARQDADDISLPDRFEAQLKYFEQYPEVALLGTSKYVISEDGTILRKVIALSNPGRTLLKENVFTHGSVMFKKAVVDELGYYNEFFKYSQDYELWLRIAKQYEVRNLKSVLYYLRFHSNNIRIKNKEQAMLFHLLAQKTIKNDLSDEVSKKIRKEPLELYVYLNKQEKAYFHKAMSGAYLRDNNLQLAIKERQKVFSLAPFNIKNNLHLLLLILEHVKEHVKKRGKSTGK